MRPILFALLLLPLAAFSQGEAGRCFYVSPQGNDKNPGTLERPFASPERARLAIRNAKTLAPEQAYTVYFREGSYQGMPTLDLQAADSGSLRFPITYAAYPGENVRLHGGVFLKNKDFKPLSDSAVLKRLVPEARGKVLVLQLKKSGISDFGTLRQHGFGTTPEPAALELFIDGQRQALARYPNEGILKIGKLYDRGSIPRQGDHSNRGAEFGYEYERPARWLLARDIWLHGHFSFGYADDHLQVQQLDTARRSIRLAQPHIYGLYSSLYADTSKWVERVGLSMRGYYAYNLLEEIDQPGEWYLDRESGLLYLYPPPAFAAATVEISLRETPFIRLQHTAHIRLENLAFSTARGMGIYLENCHHIDIVACRFSNLGTVAISAGQTLEHSAPQYSAEGAPLTDIWASEAFHHLRIQNCHIARTGTGGIILTGGERRTLGGSQNEISACSFERVDEVNHSYAPAVKLFGVGSTVSHCQFQDLRHMALSFMGNEHRIEYNRFERICTETDDMAAIYTGRDPSARGTVIRHNHFRDILPQDAQSQVGAIFIDDGSGGIEIAHNWFERCGSRGDEEMFGCIALHGGFGNTIHHNLFQDCDIAVGNNYWSAEKWKTFLETPLMRQRLQEAVDISSAVFQEKYPDLHQPFGGERLNQVAHNWLIRSNMVLQGRLELDRNKMLDPTQLDVALKKIGFDRAQIGPR